MNKNKNKNKIKLFAAPYIAAKALPVLNTQITSSRLQSNFSTVKNTTAAAREKSSLALGRKLSKKESILLGAKKAWDTPNLPAYLLALHNNIFVRIFRILPLPREEYLFSFAFNLITQVCFLNFFTFLLV